LPQKEKIIIFWLVILYHKPIAMHVRTQKNSSAKKIIQFKFFSFQENILCKDNRYLKEKYKLNNLYFLNFFKR